MTNLRFRAFLRMSMLACMGLLLSCSLSTFERTECTTDEGCVASFGAGSSCNAEGFCTTVSGECVTHDDCGEGWAQVCVAQMCTTATPHPRCALTYPEDLFSRLEDFTLVAGNLMDRSLETHQARENAARLAFRQANEQGGIDGGEVGLILCTIEENASLDGLTRREAAQETAQWLAEEVGVPAIVGPAASGDTQAVFETVRDSGTLVISPSATSPELTRLDNTSPTDENPGLLWRTAPPDSIQGRVLAQDLLARDVMEIFAVVESGAYGEGLLAVFSDVYMAGGGTIVAAPQFPAGNTSARDEQLVMAGMSTAPEILFISSQTPDAVAALSVAATSPSFMGKSILLTDAAGTSEVLNSADPGLQGRIRGTRPAPISGFVYEAFLGAYSGAHPGMNASDFTFTAQAFDAAWLVIAGSAYGVYQGGGVSGMTIAQGIRRFGDGEASELRGSTWPTTRNHIREGRGVDLQGASGSLDYDPDTEETTADIEVWGILFCGAEREIASTDMPGGTIACE